MNLNAKLSRFAWLMRMIGVFFGGGLILVYVAFHIVDKEDAHDTVALMAALASFCAVCVWLLDRVLKRRKSGGAITNQPE